jgi:hypothetical protein
MKKIAVLPSPLFHNTLKELDVFQDFLLRCVDRFEVYFNVTQICPEKMWDLITHSKYEIPFRLKILQIK